MVFTNFNFAGAQRELRLKWYCSVKQVIFYVDAVRQLYSSTTMDRPFQKIAAKYKTSSSFSGDDLEVLIPSTKCARTAHDGRIYLYGLHQKPPYGDRSPRCPLEQDASTVTRSRQLWRWRCCLELGDLSFTERRDG